MKVFFLGLLFLVGAGLTGMAHPGTGIVINSNGILFYTDLDQVWMINPDGSKSIAVPGVHTHELFLSADGTLYGEHLWYNGEALDTWGYYLWSWTSDGVIHRIKDSTAGFPDWNSFTRDTSGNQFYLERSVPSRFWKIDQTGKKEIISSGDYDDIGRLFLNKKGVLFFSNGADVYAIPPGDSIELFVSGVGVPDVYNTNEKANGVIWGMWGDVKQNLYLATGRVIKKVDHRKLVTTIYQSAGDWFPVSGVVADNGDFWVLEYNRKNEVRVNKISMDERKQIVAQNQWRLYGVPLLLTLIVIGIMYFLFRKKSD